MLPISSEDFRGLIQALIEVSPSAKLCHDSEGYLLNMEEDAVTPEAITEVLMLRLVDDLDAIGVHLQGMIGEICDGWSLAPEFIKLCGMLLPADLDPALRRDPKLRVILRGILDGDSGLDVSAILEILGILQEIPEYNRKYGPMAARLMDYVESTEVFETYLQKHIEDNSEFNMNDEISASDVTPYLNAVAGYRRNFMKLLGQLSALDYARSLYDKLEARVDSHIRDLTATDALGRMALAWNLSQDAAAPMTDSEREVLKHVNREVHTSSPLYPQAWILAHPNQTPESDDLIGMALWANAVSPEMSLSDVIDGISKKLDIAYPGLDFKIAMIDLLPTTAQET